MTYIVGVPGAAFVTDASGTFSLVAGVPVTTLDAPAQALLAGLVADADSIQAPTIVGLAGGLALLPDLVPGDDSVKAPTLVVGAVSLLPGLVPHGDAVHTPTVVAGSVTLSAALVPNDDDIKPPFVIGASGLRVLSPASYTDDDSIFSATVAAGARTLLPGRPIDAEAFYAPMFGQDRFLRPPLVSAGEIIYAAYDIDTVKPPREQKLRGPLVPVPDTIYSARLSSVPLVHIDQDIIYAVITQAEYPLLPGLVTDNDVIRSPFVAMVAQPVLVPSDDAFYGPVITLFLVPALLDDKEIIPAADVGWQVIADFTSDDDQIFDVLATAYNELLPEALLEEDEINTYPFFVQSVTGGIPVPDPVGLTGSISYPRRLRGSISTRRQLTGSISRRRELTGSIKPR